MTHVLIVAPEGIPSLRATLEGQGPTVGSAMDGAEALLEARQTPPGGTYPSIEALQQALRDSEARLQMLHELGEEMRAATTPDRILPGALRLLGKHLHSHAWASSDAAIVQEVLERCWTTLEQRTVEAKIRQSELLLRIAGRAARLGGWSLELPSRRLTWSDEVCAIHEVPPGTVPSLEQAILFYAPEFRETVSKYVDACAREGVPFDFEVQLVTANDRRVWVRAIGYAERDSTGAISMLQGAFQDVDEQRKLQDQLRQSQKMQAVGQLAGGVAHDFNNLLSVIVGYTTQVLEALEPNEPLRDDIEEVLRAAERATAITRQLLAFGRQQVLQPQVLDVGQVVHGMANMLQRLIGEDIEFSLLRPRSLGRVHTDPSQVEQIIMNLAVNACGC
jgi:C4-dicarboxylate-specific signal transduction histidine kinase